MKPTVMDNSVETLTVGMGIGVKTHISGVQMVRG